MFNKLNSTDWLTPLHVNKAAEVSIICFPYAGGNPSTFFNWHKYFSFLISLYVCPTPGYIHLKTGEYYETIDCLIPKICTFIISLLPNQQLIFVGHSLGGLIAYETSYYLQKHYSRELRHLIISASRPLHLVSPKETIHHLPDDQFLTKLNQYHGIPQAVMNDKDLMACLIPIFRNDFRIYETYPKQNSFKTINSDLTAIHGEWDTHITREQIQLWSHYTNKKFQHFSIAGDHLFINKEREKYLNIVSKVI